MNQETQTEQTFNVIFIVDESGSMETMTKKVYNPDNSFTEIKEPVTAITGFIENYKKENSSNNTTFSFTFFNSIVRELPDNKEITNSDYNPGGMTALHDAICQTINKKLEKNQNATNTILIIITDGEENSSYIYNLKDTQKTIAKVERENKWKVIFLGANIDVMKEGSSMNIQRERTCEYDQTVAGNLNVILRSASIDVANYTHNVSLGIEDDLQLNMPKLELNEDCGEVPLFLQHS